MVKPKGTYPNAALLRSLREYRMVSIAEILGAPEMEGMEDKVLRDILDGRVIPHEKSVRRLAAYFGIEPRFLAAMRSREKVDYPTAESLLARADGVKA